MTFFGRREEVYEWFVLLAERLRWFWDFLGMCRKALARLHGE